MCRTRTLIDRSESFVRVGFVLKETGCQIGHLERKLVYSEVNFISTDIRNGFGKME